MIYKHLRISLIFGFFALSFCLRGQEICNNGIDDDNDGLIDLQDDDCTCHGIDILVSTSLFPNPSFENNVCAAGFSRAHCAFGWINPSEGTPDYLDDCGRRTHAFLPIAPCPMPEGNRCFGIGDLLLNEGEIHKEYVGTQLVSPLQQDTSYLLSFWIGYLDEALEQQPGGTNWASRPTTFYVYGNVDTNAVPFDGKGCPTQSFVDTSGRTITPWEIIGSVELDEGNFEWKNYAVSFTASKDYKMVLLGPSCEVPRSSHYYFLDNLVLSKASAFSTDFIVRQSGHVCTNDLILEVPDMNMGTSINYQWYKNGIAIPGAVNTSLSIHPLPDGAGDYQCTISNLRGCITSDPYVVSAPADIEILRSANSFCEGESMTLSLSKAYSSYSWSTGETLDAILIDHPGDYALTVVDADGCQITDTIEIVYNPDVEFSIDLLNQSHPDIADGQITIHFISPGGSVLWANGSTDNPLTDLVEDEYCFTASAPEHCPVEQCVDLNMDIQPIIVAPTITPLTCHGDSDAQIDIVISGGVPPLHWTWAHDPRPDLLELDNLAPGTYIVDIRDAVGGRKVDSIVIPDVAPITYETEIVTATCAGSDDGQIGIVDIQGGYGGYNIQWNGLNIPEPAEITNVSPGYHNLSIADLGGCVLSTQVYLAPTIPIEVTLRIEPASCTGQQNGMIAIDTIKGGTPPYAYAINGVSTRRLSDLMGNAYYPLELTDVNGCAYSQSVFVGMKNGFDVDLGEDRIIEEGQRVLIQPAFSAPISSLIWYDNLYPEGSCLNCPYWETIVEQDYEVRLKATNEQGCEATDTVLITMTPSTAIYIPNAISPNNDGINDEFRLFHTEFVDHLRLIQLFDSKGTELFKAENVSLDPCMDQLNRQIETHDYPVGGYLYQIMVVYKDGQERLFRGSLQLLR